ncbi:hypothetical protein SV7mr_12880 [Stieleria bergensis]|uniref:Sialate O-acetylesterase domain-containing protein n=2 Tax=Stieleria bergensis TaxID=2528025 RepID=A0A517SRN1_9BACT|nr:hypothetical protein SV7mr_12880 [Planctomycetes bacterium SV_7m_r]
MMLQRHLSRTRLLLGSLALLVFLTSHCNLLTNQACAQDTVQVYILAGQSNMEGKAKNSLFDHQASAPETKEFFAHLRDGEKWLEMDDVFINYLNRNGHLTLGYGSRDRTGIEYEFGYRMGKQHKDPVLLIKTCWGGHSLYKKFRSPSNPVPDSVLKQDLEQQVKNVQRNNEKKDRNDPAPTADEVRQQYGDSYRMMVDEVTNTLKELDTRFPELAGKKTNIAGFVWFQGWNDQYNGAETEYDHNLRMLVDDIRKEWKKPKLPVVIAVMGQNMSQEAKGAMKVIQDAQIGVAESDEYKDSVRAVRTAVLVDKAAEELYPNWRQNFEKWEKTGSDFAYHYMGSAIWMTRIGGHCADAMIELVGKD